MMIGALLCTVLIGVIIRLLADESKAWLPWITEQLIRRAVKTLPESQRERYGEEWRSYLNEAPGEIGKLVSGLGFLRASWKMSERQVHERSIFFRPARLKVYLIGEGNVALRIKDALQSKPELGMDVIGWASYWDAETRTHELLWETLRNLGEKQSLNQVIVAPSHHQFRMPVNELLDLKSRGISIVDGTALLESMNGKVEIDQLSRSWLILEGNSWIRDISSRCLSAVSALVLTLMVFALFPLIAIMIKLTSNGPIFSRQKTVGLNGRIFSRYRFRTMRAEIEGYTERNWVCDNKPKFTTVGRVLRTLALDELPLMLNILREDMAFVGPQPERPETVEELSRAIPFYGFRHTLRPGVTGWAQTLGITTEDAKEQLGYDLFYVKHGCPGFDLLIILRTIRAVFSGRRKK